MSSNNETKVVSDFNELNISDKNSISANINHDNCYDPDNGKFWCKECVPRFIIEGWTSGSDDIDNLIKDSIYDTCYGECGNPSFLEWVPFDRFKNMKQIGEGGFAKVYSATWIDGNAKYFKQDDGNWIKEEPNSMLKTHWKLNCKQSTSLKFYGITKDPETEEFMMMIMAFTNPDAIYTSRIFTFKDLSKPINSCFIATKYLNEEYNKDCQDSQLIDLEVPGTSKLEDGDSDN
ncbi:unnamed protein product [Rhizophagus irregularis]|nr:unnamed protein product [Rhizophagus irregularis]